MLLANVEEFGRDMKKREGITSLAQVAATAKLLR
jgi:hypothetical protein